MLSVLKVVLVFSEGDMACFSEYMEIWIHSARLEGLQVWLSGALQVQGNYFWQIDINMS